MKRKLSIQEGIRVDQLCQQGKQFVPLVIKKIAKAGGVPYLVGGAVRDLILEFSLKDLDIEVHGLSIEQLQSILQEHGTVDYVGKSFGVLKLRSDSIVDWALPRTDRSGRRPEVEIDPNMGIEQALRRRDVTMNAMAVDLLNYELYDPFGGVEDIHHRRLRCADKRFFVEDPLRFFRVMQFIGRFDMEPDEELQKICKSMDLAGISRERIEQEFNKLLLLSRRPARGFRWLKDLGRLQEILPELHDLVDVEQNSEWHPEGNVFEHTMQTLDAAAIIAQRFDDQNKRLILMYAALCHDLGKAETTAEVDGVLRSIGHDVAGVEPTRKLLARCVGSKKMTKTIELLVRYHTQPGSYITNNARLSRYKHLAVKLAPKTNLYMLAMVAFADKLGRNSEGQEPFPIDSKTYVDDFINRSEDAGVLFGPELPVITGENLRPHIEPGPLLGKAVKKAYEIQIDEGIRKPDVLEKRVLSLMKAGKL